MSLQLRTKHLEQALRELSLMKAAGPQNPSNYRASLRLVASGVLEELLEHVDSECHDSSSQVCEKVADWLWLRILGWCQTHHVSDTQQDELLRLMESVRAGVPIEAPSTT